MNDESLVVLRDIALEGDVAVDHVDREELHERAVETTPIETAPIDVPAAEVNYIRHQLVEIGGVPYERLADPLMEEAKASDQPPETTVWGKAYRDLKARVLRAIARRYPTCEEECERQLRALSEKFGTPSDPT